MNRPTINAEEQTTIRSLKSLFLKKSSLKDEIKEIEEKEREYLSKLEESEFFQSGLSYKDESLSIKYSQPTPYTVNDYNKKIASLDLKIKDLHKEIDVWKERKKTYIDDYQSQGAVLDFKSQSQIKITKNRKPKLNI